MAQYPYTIENGSGERLTFTGIVHGPDGDRVEADGFATPGAGPPMHVHLLQEEAEFFLSSIFASMKATGKNRPAIFDAAFLITRYRSEFGMPAIPAPVQRVVFPIAIAIGRLLGKYHKYAGAPPPMSR